MSVKGAEIQRMLASFRRPHFSRFVELSNTPSTKTQLVDEIVKFLNDWDGQDWIDYETIEFLGRDISRNSTPEFLDALNSKLSSEVPNDAIKQAFLSRQDAPNRDLGNASLPAHSEFTKQIAEIESADGDWDMTRVSALLTKYLAYYRATGDYQPVGFALDRIFGAAQENPEIEYAEFHHILDATILEVFSINATDKRMWLRWAGSFLKLGDNDSAGYVLWEAFRRRPDEPYIAFALLKIFGRTDYHYQNRIRFANMARTRFHFNRYLELEYHRLNGYSRIFEQSVRGIEGLIGLIARVDDVKYETVSLASILSRKWDEMEREGYTDRFLSTINEALHSKPALIASVAYRLFKYHDQLDAAKRILLSRSALLRDKQQIEIVDNTLAKMLSQTGNSEDIAEGINILRKYSGPSSRNHLAKLLFLRGQDGDWQEAEGILRSNIDLNGSDYYAISQLAGLLMHYGENRRAEAIQLLTPHASENEPIRYLLDAIERNEFARIDEEVDDVGEIEDEVTSEYDPTGLSAISARYGFRSLRSGLPDELRENAYLRKLKFEIDYGTKESAKRALDTIRLGSFNVHTEYLTFLESSYFVNAVEEKTTGTFGADLVRAYSSRKIKDLKEVEEEAPRLGIIVRFAQAALGDESAANVIEQLRITDASNAPWERELVSSVCNSRFGKNLLIRMSAGDSSPAANENIRRLSDLVGAVVTLESFAA